MELYCPARVAYGKSAERCLLEKTKLSEYPKQSGKGIRGESTFKKVDLDKEDDEVVLKPISYI